MKTINKEVGEYLDYCRKVRGMTEATLVAKRNILGRFVREAGVGSLVELDNAAFNRWITAEVERGVSARSLNTYNAAVLAMVRYFREMGVVVPLKTALVGKVKDGSEVRRRFYTVVEVSRAVKLADEQVGLMIRVMFETGMRITELTRLRVSDFSGRRVKFMGKGRKTREVYVSAVTYEDLREFWWRFGRGATDYVWGTSLGFRTENGLPPTTATVREWMRRPFIEAGIEDFYPHALRHSFATGLQRNGASVAEIKEMMGHSNVATTERYLHGFEGRLEELFDKYQNTAV